jgi:hypothetical protein
MHPCQACGAVEVDDVGYCSNCRVYQGMTSYEVGPPAGNVYHHGAPGSPVAVGVATPEEVHAARYDAAVYAAPAPEAAPVSGAAAQAPARATPALLMPLFVVTVIMLLITSGTLVAFVLRSDALNGDTKAAVDPPKPTPSAAPSGPPSAAAAPALADDCLYGTWAVTRSVFLLVGKETNAEFESTGGTSTFRFAPDGTGSWDLSGFTYEHRESKRKAVYTGQITFTVKSASQSLTFTTVKTNAQAVWYKAGKEESTAPVGPMYPSMSYACGGSVVVMETETIAFELRRA